jgi:hypothetical protein
VHPTRNHKVAGSMLTTAISSLGGGYLTDKSCGSGDVCWIETGLSPGSNVECLEQD